MNLLPILLAIHISLAITLFLPSMLLPLALRRRPDATQAGAVVGFLLLVQARGTVVIGLGLALSGVSLLLILGPTLVSQPWLLTALVIYALNLAVAYFIQRPSLRRLLRMGAADDTTWRLRARRQRYISYAMAALVGAIGVLMSAKPALW